VARALNLKFAPEIRFREDESFEEATRIDRLLDSDRVKRDVKPKDDAEGDE
jgi:ribosome-binding factor A